MSNTKKLFVVSVLVFAGLGCSKPTPRAEKPSRGALQAGELSPKDAKMLAKPEVVRALLGDAAREDDAETIRSLARHHVDVDQPLGEGRTALSIAAYKRSGRAVQALLEAGADPDGKGADLSPLMHAAFVGDTAIALDLVRAGAPIDRPTSMGQTPLMFAALFGRQETYDALARAGADEGAQDRVANTPKSLKAYANNAEAVEQFLRRTSGKVADLAKGIRDR